MKIEILHGAILRDGVEIAREGWDRGGARVVISPEALSPSVKGRINTALGAKATYHLAAEAPELLAEIDALSHAAGGIDARAGAETGAGRKSPAAGRGRVKEPPPPYDPAAGDKAPAHIAWFARNHTAAEFAERYHAGRGVRREEYVE